MQFRRLYVTVHGYEQAHAPESERSGNLFVDEHGVVRFLTDADQATMRAVASGNDRSLLDDGESEGPPNFVT